MTSVTWILESDVFPNSHGRLREAIDAAGHRIVESRDEWWLHEPPEFDPETPIIFHGSLGNAAVIQMKANCFPGSFCPVNDFCCTAWYPQASPWLIHRQWRCLQANKLIADAASVAAEIGCVDRIFVRPDSPLKPFSGRVLDVGSISLKALDHGFYYEDETLPVIVAPIVDVGPEWRFVVVEGRVVAGSAYDADTRSAADTGDHGGPVALAKAIASSIAAPAPVYVVDICQVGEALKRQAVELGLDQYTAVIGLGGKEYRVAVSAAFDGTKVEPTFPFAGLPIGKAMQATKQAIENLMEKN